MKEEPSCIKCGTRENLTEEIFEVTRKSKATGEIFLYDIRYCNKCMEEGIAKMRPN